ncbi:hypothetical protein AA103196_0094 [Ameyamaea chiangmaiensis NBRC 103196]|uniref:Stringent starvation protein B n=1 Tax=Ameyamaea chiangmaiensis TaxID=442969 RepID=A0A850P557_9PROT|nr:ClpXP protease specificity-enhancing factor SspB [Ameyamaea chiangmaiensis]MBS4075947.1 hypothetical protein [Ameyamaea chiangmaiensis]NVN39767.1 hypothetical protein [Ameyamaea chiangmaiensis]GBQ61644.1 hypothetical protein AA103196_0094 [Ameyamaea chiangmaiensis NBRC 103196]
MTDDSDESGFDGLIPDSLLPYDRWIEDAYRQVMLRALDHAAVHGLPGEHHFYITFRTDWTGVVIPPRLRAQYPHEMTIVLQHQFWDLKVDHAAGVISVGLSFGGTGSILSIPVAAVTAFADPSIQMALRFTLSEDETADEAGTGDGDAVTEVADDKAEGDDVAAPQVVSLDAFRKRGPSST